MNKPLVSIIISTFNRKECLENAVQSALEQTYDNKEIVISDDCSTDGTEEIGTFLALKYFNVKYFRNEKNLKTAGNWKKAFFEYSKGNFITVLNDDDMFLDKNFINDAMAIFEKNKDKNLVCVFSNVLYKIYYSTLDFYEEKLSYNTFPQFIEGMDLFYSDYFLHTDNGAIYTRESLYDLELFNHTISTLDVEMLYKLMMQGKFAYLPKVTYLHNLNQECLGRVNSKKFFNAFQASEWIDSVYAFYVKRYGNSDEIEVWLEKKMHKFWKSLLHLIEFDYETYVYEVVQRVPKNTSVTLLGEGRNLEMMKKVLEEKRGDLKILMIEKDFITKDTSDIFILGINDYVDSFKVFCELIDNGIQKSQIFSILSSKLKEIGG